MVPRVLCHLRLDGVLAPGPGPAGARRVWPYTQDRRWPARNPWEGFCDPVNLVLAGAAPGVVMATLAARGWHVPVTGQAHRAWVDGRLRPMHGHLALGPDAERMHVRLWAVGAATVAAAHYERRDRLGMHRVVSWDAARAQVLADLVVAGWEPIGRGDPVALRDVRGVPGDGRAWAARAPRAPARSGLAGRRARAPG